MEADIPSPPPDSFGTSQEKPKDLVVAPCDTIGIKPLTIANRIDGLAASHSRSLGGEIGAQLIAGSFQQLSSDLECTKSEMKELRQQLHLSQSKLASTETQLAVCSEKRATLGRLGMFSNGLTTLGMIPFGIGIDQVRNSDYKFGVPLILAGCLSLIISWLLLPLIRRQ